jgi:uncharacterized protein YcbK (DUF882 family)
MNDPRHVHRRRFLQRSAGLAAGSLVPMGRARSQAPDSRSLSFVHTHTGERLQLVFALGTQYVPQALALLNRFLRDHYSGEIGVIDPRLFDLLHLVHQTVGGSRPFEVISGYRCAATNATLRETRGGGVAKSSLHMEGRAIDVRLPGVALADLRDAAVSLKVGGVGFYPGSQFVHLDTGRVRRW